MKFKNTLKSIWDTIVSFYTSRTIPSYIAIAVTLIASLSLITVVSITVISNVTNADEIATTTGETSISDIFDVASEDTSTIPVTTTVSPETTTVPETEAANIPETETTTVLETTTVQETTTPPETIDIADIQVGNPEDSDEIFVDKSDLEDEFMEEFEPETPEPATKPTAGTKPAQQETTTKPVQDETTAKPETKPPVSEYSCVVKGIDISKWNSQGKPAIDWAKVKASGVEYVIIRVGNRSISSTNIYEDPYFKAHIEGALSSGLQVGVYFYSQAITEKEALEEASFVLSLIKDYKITYPVVFDWEPASGTRVKAANLSKAQATAIAKKFLSTIEGYGYEAMLYSYHSAIMNYFDTSKLSEYKTWVAWYFSKYKETGVQYQTGDPLPDTNYPYQMWQYSSTGTVPGITGYVDLNVSFFSYTGSGVPSSAITLKLPAASYTTNLGAAIDYKTGVKAFNTAGLDVSSSVTTAICDSNGNLISEKSALENAGVYTITYTIKDFTGVSKSAAAKLTVRANPTFRLAEDELTFNIHSSSYEDIINAIKDNLISVTDNEGNSLNLSDVTITGLDFLCSEDSAVETNTTNSETSDTTTDNNPEVTNNETVSNETTSGETSAENDTTNITNGLMPGTYTITYTITDSKDATGTADIIVNIVDEEQTTTPAEASSDDSSSMEEASSFDETTSLTIEAE